MNMAVTPCPTGLCSSKPSKKEPEVLPVPGLLRCALRYLHVADMDERVHRVRSAGTIHEAQDRDRAVILPGPGCRGSDASDSSPDGSDNFSAVATRM